MTTTIIETPSAERVFKRLPPELRAGLRINEASDYLGISRSSIYALINRGLIQTVRIGSRRVVLRASLDSTLQSLSGIKPAA